MKKIIFLLALMFIFPSWSLEMDLFSLEGKEKYESHEFDQLRKRIPYIPSDVTSSQISEKMKPGKNEKKIINEWIDYSDSKRKIILDEISIFNPKYINVFTNAFQIEREIFLNLYSGRFDFGRANSERLENYFIFKKQVRMIDMEIEAAKIEKIRKEDMERSRRETEIALKRRQEDADRARHEAERQRRSQCEIIKARLNQLNEQKNDMNGAMSNLALAASAPGQYNYNYNKKVEQERIIDQQIYQVEMQYATYCR